MRCNFTAGVTIGCLFAFMLALLSSLSLVAGEAGLRRASFAIDSFAGCRVEGGVITLLDRMPLQVAGAPLVMEAEGAYSMVYQDDVFARREGAGGANIVQIKRGAEEYSPQYDDPQAIGGYIDYCSRAVYQFKIIDGGEYYIWARHWLPFLSGWDYSMDIDGEGAEKIRLAPHVTKAKTWTWVRCRKADLSAGVHSLSVSQLVNGKRMDRILMTRDRSFIPAGDGEAASPSLPVDEGVVRFSPLSPVGIKEWRSLGWEKKEGAIDFRISGDSGVTWNQVVNYDVGTLCRGFGQIALEARLRRLGNQGPLLRALVIDYTYDPGCFIVIEGGGTRLSFDRSSGTLSGIENTVSGSAYMPLGTVNAAFAMTFKRPGHPERERVTSVGVVPCIRSAAENKVGFTWDMKKTGVVVDLDVAIASTGLAEWNFSISNERNDFDVMEFEMLRIGQVRISRRAADDVLVWPFTAGEIIRGPASRWEMGIEYPDHAGFPWFDIAGGDEGLYVGMHDPFLVGTVFTAMPGANQESMGFSLVKKHRIRAGGKQSYSFVLAAHEGDWHAAARIYREYFYSRYGRNSSPDWLRDSIGWISGGALSGRDPKAVYSDLEKDFKRASFLGMPYIQGWGSTMNGACPTYYAPRIDRGGEEALSQMIHRWRSVGGSIGYYFHGNSLGSYYTLSDRYFGVPWSAYPEDQRPWPWDRYIRNAFYPSESSLFDKAKLQAAVDGVNARIARGEQVRNKDIEGIDDYQPFNWASSDFPDYLKKWVRTYVSKYGSNTAYLDTFAFYNGRPDFNPYLGHHGESDLAMYKLPWLHSFMREMKELEPSFSCLTEGVLDVFGSDLSFLLSGFQRDSNVMRYMLPDQIFYLGNSNALWTEPLSRKSLSNAFLFGMKYDLITTFPHSYYMVRLMQRVAPFLSRAVFDDDIGLKVGDASIRAFAHIMTDASARLVDNHGQRTVAITFHNPEKKPAVVTYVLPQGFQVHRAFVCELYRGASYPLDVRVVGDGRISFQAPMAESAAVILVDDLPPAYAVTSISRQRNRSLIEVELFNYSAEAVTVAVVASGPDVKLSVGRQTISVPPGVFRRVELEDAEPSDAYRPLLVEVSCGGRTQKLISGFGVLGFSIPSVPQGAGDEARRNVLIDFDEGEDVSEDRPYRGRGCIEVMGTGKLLHRSVRLPLLPGTEYDLSFALRKVAGSPHGWVAVSNYTSDNRLETFGRWGGGLKGDGEWQVIRGRFRTANELNGRCALYVYNDGISPLWCDEIDLRAVQSNAAAEAPSASSAVLAPGSGEGAKFLWKMGFDDGGAAKLVKAFLSSDRPFAGSRCLALAGDGGYRFERFPLSLRPGERYRVRAAIRKDRACAAASWQSMIGVCSYDQDGGLNRHGFWGGDVPLDDIWHVVGGEFTAPMQANRCSLYCYNINSSGTASFDEITIESVRP